VNYFPIDQVPQKLNRFDIETSDLYTRAKQSRLFFKKLFPFTPTKGKHGGKTGEELKAEKK